MTFRRTGLKPGKPLARGGPLRRFTPLAKVPAKRSGGHRMPLDVAALVRKRSGGRCEIGMDGCWGTARELHHRVTQKSGGRHGAARRRSDRPSNVMHGCGRCHLIVTDHPGRAYCYGWSLREWQEPTQHPVLYRGDLVYLTDGGDVVSFEKAGA